MHSSVGYLLGVLLFLVSGSVIFARTNPPVLIHQMGAGGTGTDSAAVIHARDAHRYSVFGTSDSAQEDFKKMAPRLGGSDFWTVNTFFTNNLIQVNDASNGGADPDVLTCVEPTLGAYLAGGWSSVAPNGRQFRLIQVATNGPASSFYGGVNDEEMLCIQMIGEPRILGSDVYLWLGGFSSSPPSGTKESMHFGSRDFWLVKVDTNRTKLFDQSYGGSGRDVLKDIEPTRDFKVLLCGTSDSGMDGTKSAAAYGENDFWIVKTDLSGAELWQQSYGGSSNDAMAAVCRAAGSGYLLAGESRSPVGGSKTSPSFGGADFWVIKIDENGVQQWDKSFGGSGDDALRDVVALPDGGYLLGGYSNSTNGTKSSPGFGGYDYWVIHIDESGNKVWDETFGGTEDDYLSDIHCFDAFTYFITGSSASHVSGNKTRGNNGLLDFWSLALSYRGIGFYRRPADVATYPGRTVILDPLLSGDGPFKMQWRFNGTPITGATNQQLTLASASTNQSGTYQLRATNAYGDVVASAVVSIQPLSLRSVTLTNASLQFQVRGPTGAPIRVEGSSNFVLWSPLLSTNLSAHNPGLLNFNQSNLPSGPAFFRARSED